MDENKTYNEHVLEAGSARKYTNRARKVYSGAGVVVIETDYHRKGPAFILYRNRRTGLYEDLGGLIDSSDHAAKYPIAHAAKREAQEESNFYLRFKNTGTLGKTINGQDIFQDNREYRGYFIGIPTGMFFRREQKDLLKSAPVGSSRNEMDDVVRVYLRDYVNSGGLVTYGTDLTNVTAYTGKRTTKQITIKGRTQGLIREGLKSGIITLAINNPKNVTRTNTRGFTQLKIQ
jgi:8-oxo-dGTP pyrophosphatase MutT (NUDIX family)